MAGIESLMSSYKEVKLNDEVTIKVPPLRVSEVSKFKSINDDEKQLEFFERKIDEVLKFNFPESTKEQRDAVSLQYAAPILSAIMEATGFNSEKLEKMKAALQ